MSERTLLGKFLVALRERRNLTVRRLSHRMNVDPAEVIRMEKCPERTPSCEIAKYLKAIRITDEEYIDFQRITYDSIEVGDGSSSKRESGVNSGKVIEFRANGINGDSKKSSDEKSE